MKILERELENKTTKLTEIGVSLCRMTYKERQLKLVSLMVEHRIFADFFDYVIDNNGELPSKQQVCDKMRELNVCKSESTMERRACSVLSWLKWIFNLPHLAE